MTESGWPDASPVMNGFVKTSVILCLKENYLGAHAQRGLQQLSCVSVCLCVCVCLLPLVQQTEQ